MPFTEANLEIKNGRKRITYVDKAGTIEIREGGSRSWRNNNPGNTKGGKGAISKDKEGFDIFPDEDTGRKAKEQLLKQKYGDYESIRQMLKGKFNKNGDFIDGTGYAPKKDSNDPDKYADQIKEWTGLDVDKKKINDLNDSEFAKLVTAIKRKEGWIPGERYMSAEK